VGGWGGWGGTKIGLFVCRAGQAQAITLLNGLWPVIRQINQLKALLHPPFKIYIGALYIFMPTFNSDRSLPLAFSFFLVSVKGPSG
jgi:hypothetical protein